MNLAELKSNYPEFNIDIQGDINASFIKISAAENASEDSLIYVLNEKYIAPALSSKAKQILIHSKLKEQLQDTKNKNIIFADEPEVLIAQLLQEHFSYEKEISLQAENLVIDPSADIAESVLIGANTVIGKNVKIGKNTRIGPANVIQDGAVIGENVCMGSHNLIGNKVLIKNNVKMHSHNIIGSEAFLTGNNFGFAKCQGSVELQESVEMGSSNTFEFGLINNTIVQSGTKLDNRVFIGSESNIGPDSFLTAGVKVSHNVSTGRHFVIGGNSSVLANINICDGVQVGAISVVDKDVNEPGAYGGFPLQKMRDYLKTSMTLTKLATYRKEFQKLIRNEQ